MRPNPRMATRTRRSLADLGIAESRCYDRRPTRGRRSLEELAHVQTRDTREIRVLLVDDHQLLVDALTQVLQTEPGIRITGVARSVGEAKIAARERADVVLMDYRLPDGTG